MQRENSGSFVRFNKPFPKMDYMSSMCITLPGWLGNVVYLCLRRKDEQFDEQIASLCTSFTLR